jgi:hypothetical protein
MRRGRLRYLAMGWGRAQERIRTRHRLRISARFGAEVKGSRTVGVGEEGCHTSQGVNLDSILGLGETDQE